MKRIIFLGALLLAACSQSQSGAGVPAKLAGQVTPTASAHGSLSPSAPVNLTYRIENGIAGQLQNIDVAITTRLNSGMLLVEVARQEGVDVVGETVRRIDLATAPRPISLQLQAMALGAGEHFLVLLLTIETEMGPMSRSFRIDVTPVAE